MADRQRILATLGAAFPRDRIKPDTFALYLAHTADIGEDALAAAVDELIRSGDYFPTIRALRETAAEHALDLPTEAQALEQITARMDWARLDEHERPADPPEVHPLVRRALDLVGGYAAFRETDRPGVIRSQFGRAYADLRGVEVRHARVGPALPAGPERRALEAGAAHSPPAAVD